MSSLSGYLQHLLFFLVFKFDETSQKESVMPHHNVQQYARSGWGKLPTNYSVLVMLATVLLIFIATIGGKNLYFRGDYDIFFDGTNEQLLAFDEIQTTFAKSDSLALVIAPKSGTVFTPSTLSLIQQNH